MLRDSITYIIASYNDQDKIGVTLDSVKENLQNHDQIIVVDGKSTDDSQNIAQSVLATVGNKLIICEQDSGIYDAWNKAITMASGSWLCFLGCGDILAKTYRAEMSEAIKLNVDVNFIHFIAQLYALEKDGYKKMFKYGKSLDRIEFKKRMRVCHVGALHHRELFQGGSFSTAYQCVSDYHFLLKNLDIVKACFVNKVLVNMEGGGISSRIILPHNEVRKMKRDLGTYNQFLLWLEFFEAVVKSLIFRSYHFIYQRLGLSA